jgi:hypothetical protein
LEKGGDSGEGLLWCFARVRWAAQLGQPGGVIVTCGVRDRWVIIRGKRRFRLPRLLTSLTVALCTTGITLLCLRFVSDNLWRLIVGTTLIVVLMIAGLLAVHPPLRQEVRTWLTSRRRAPLSAGGSGP